MIRVCFIITLLLVAGLVSGCGEEQAEGPPAEARAAVVSFVTALKTGNGAQACRLADSRLLADLRVTALGAFRATASTQSERLAQVKAARASARTCPGAMRLLTRDLGDRSDQLLAGVKTLPVAWLADERQGIAVIGDEQWAVEREDGAWRVTIANAIGEALP